MVLDSWWMERSTFIESSGKYRRIALNWVSWPMIVVEDWSCLINALYLLYVRSWLHHIYQLITFKRLALSIIKLCIHACLFVVFFAEKRKKASSIMRILNYPLVMLLLSVLTAVSIIMVGLNILEIVFDRKALPAESNVCTTFILAVCYWLIWSI